MPGLRKFPSSFDAEKDCEALYKGMKGMGTDESALTKIISHRSNEQLQEIRKKYKSLYGKDLIEKLKSELSSNYEDAVVGSIMTPVEYDAYCLKKSMKGAGTDEDALIGVMVTRNNERINAIKAFYKEEYGKDLEKAIQGDTGGDFKKIMVALVQGERSESEDVDQDMAEKEAQLLVNAGEKKWGTDEASFIKILATRSYPQLRATIAEYDKISSKGFVKALKSELGGNFEDAMVSLAEYIIDPHQYFADQFRKAMKGMGTNDAKLIRLVVSRCEVDLAEIAQKYEASYGKPLHEAIRSEISGDYRKFIHQLVHPVSDE